jgi:shikimate dehydrogenase
VVSRRAEQAPALAGSLRGSAGIEIKPAKFRAETLNRLLPTAGLLVNCTPAGMWPHEQETPLPEGVSLPEGMLVYDLVYRPRPTRFLLEAQAAGCRTQDGLAMLAHQGAAAFALWTGLQAPVEVMRRACEDALALPVQQKAGKRECYTGS